MSAWSVKPDMLCTKTRVFTMGADMLFPEQISFQPAFQLNIVEKPLKNVCFTFFFV